MNRRDFIKWVTYLGAVGSIPTLASVRANATDVLEGISCVDLKIAKLAYNQASFRACEDRAFERAMQTMWKEMNGDAPYVRTVRDVGLQPACVWTDVEGVRHERPEGYVTLLQYQRAE